MIVKINSKDTSTLCLNQIFVIIAIHVISKSYEMEIRVEFQNVEV